MNPQPPKKRSSYAKPWLSYPDQLARLSARGLIIADHTAAEEFLSHVNYYRFSGFCLAYEQQRDVFRPGVTFDDIKTAYEFDVRLRDLLNEALEVIEIDIRTSVAYHFGQRHGAFGQTDPGNFFDQSRHAEWLNHVRDEVDRSSELFVEHFRNTYPEYPDLPVWMLTEVMSFGTLTRMYRAMNRPDQRAISYRYHIQATDFGTILLHLVYVRNLCAHHSRLWDRVWSMKATLPRGKFWEPPLVPSNNRLFSTLVLTYHLLTNCAAIGAFGTMWRDRLHSLLRNPPNAPGALVKMGMLADWNNHPMWSR